ncbi:MerR family transcriptional regulator [Rhodococcus oxybenzonivorans]|uniref:DNA polymerase III subunit beta family protein n=1 Tax=Rhodococcus TaxID=1827 RepID=UPI001917A31E|nr:MULTISPECIES: MerR family transcriptional regulator [Rhodococcus]MDV7357311.1 MerR family transcriptional regulator [Rhodococcus oxybenzonivorans]
MNAVLSIGELSRASGLSVSALRFYDKAGVLAPHTVDPHSSYRRYTDQQVDAAVLLAAMRRVGMPVKEMTAVLSGTDPHALLDQHLCRLEQGLADARRELTRIHRLVDGRVERGGTVVVDADDLADAVASVRFAVDPKSEFPALRGIHLETDGDVLRLVATDRYRLAVAEIAAVHSPQKSIAVTVPSTFLTDAAPRLRRHGQVAVTVDARTVTLRCGEEEFVSEALDGVFPDHRSLSSAVPGTEATISATELRAVLAGRGERVDLGVLDSGSIVVGAQQRGFADPCRDRPVLFHVQVNAGFLLDAVAALPGDQLTFRFGGPIAPLAIRPRSVSSSASVSAYSLLMPLQPAALT